MSEVTLMQILDAREHRAAKQQALLRRYGKTLICFTMNIAGPEKVSPEIEAAFRIGCRILEQLPVLYREDTSAQTGFEKFYVVDGDPYDIKKACASAEDTSPYGRLFDMDVLTPEGKISREELGLPRRKCLICERDAAICGRSRTHSVQELQQATARLLSGSIHRFIADKTSLALIQEVETTPKPGLVDCANSGSHRDMDRQSFYRSIEALQTYFQDCAQAGLKNQSPKALFEALRPLGIAAEKQMQAATGGVNTHKGAIFSLGIACAAAAACFPQTDPETVLGCCAQMTEGLVNRDFGCITEAKTAGERLYMRYGITGIRGQAEQGFPAVLHTGLPVLKEGLRQGLRLNDAGCAALLHMLAITDDTNLIKRSDLQTLREIQQRLHTLLKTTPYPDAETIKALDEEFIKRNLSPGGSADLLALTYFLYFLNN